MHDPKRMRRAFRSCSMAEVVSRASGGPRDGRAGQSAWQGQAWRPRIAPRAAASRRPALAWPDGLSDFAGRAAERVREWVLVEVVPGRLVPWLAIAFGCGIAIYFAAEREPALWAAVLVLVRRSAASWCGTGDSLFPWRRRRAGGWIGDRHDQARHHRTSRAVSAGRNVDVAGFVEVREERERSDRIVVRVERIAGPRLERDARARAGVGAQGHGAARSAASSSSRRGCRRRSSRCGPAATTSRATCISSASAHRASCSARIRARRDAACADALAALRHRRSTACARRSTSASARSCPATRARSHRR